MKTSFFSGIFRGKSTKTTASSTDGTCSICLEQPLPTSNLQRTKKGATVTTTTGKQDSATTAGEQWCMLPCGHTFGHKCLRQWLSSPHGARVCPLCRDPAVRICGHPVSPAPVSSSHSVSRRLETRLVRRGLENQRLTKCPFCVSNKETPHDTLLAMIGKHIAPVDWAAHRRYHNRLVEARWKAWWDSQTPKGPRIEAETEREEHTFALQICLV